MLWVLGAIPSVPGKPSDHELSSFYIVVLAAMSVCLSVATNK